MKNLIQQLEACKTELDKTFKNVKIRNPNFTHNRIENYAGLEFIADGKKAEKLREELKQKFNPEVGERGEMRIIELLDSKYILEIVPYQGDGLDPKEETTKLVRELVHVLRNYAERHPKAVR